MLVVLAVVFGIIFLTINFHRKIVANEEKLKSHAVEIEKLAEENYKPHENPKATINAYNTLFVGRLSYNIDELMLKREMENYGIIKTVIIPKDKKAT